MAVTYCLLMECDKSCGNAGVRGSESQGVECVSVPACVHAFKMCVCVCLRTDALMYLRLFVSLSGHVFVRCVSVWGRRAEPGPFTAHLAQMGPPGW